MRFQIRGERPVAAAMLAVMLAVTSLWGWVDTDRVISPEKGVTVGRGYQIGEMEQVNMSNGGLTLRIPLASLPAGPAGTPGVTLAYNSKYWEDKPVETWEASSKAMTHALQASPSGGWVLSYDYEVRIIEFEKYSTSDPCVSGSVNDLFQMVVATPDGSEHRMYRMIGMPSGCEVGVYRLGDMPGATVPDVWYSLDGSFLRLEMSVTGEVWKERDWTLYEPDGGRVEHTGTETVSTTVRYDKSGNKVTWSKGYTTEPGCTGSVQCALDVIADEFGHSIEVVEFPDGHTEVRSKGKDGTPLTAVVRRADLDFGQLKYYNNSGGGTQTEAFLGAGQVPTQVTEVDLPARSGPSGSYTPKFFFEYNATYRELSKMTTPTGATVEYSWALDNVSAQRYYSAIQGNALTQKKVTHDGQVETTSYNFPSDNTTAWNLTGSSVTGPDGGTTAYEFVDPTAYWAGQNPYGGVIRKVTRPDGSVAVKTWVANPPAMDTGVCTVGGVTYACNLNEKNNRRNQYVSWEYETAVNSLGTPMRVKTREYEVDQNGNQLKVKERDWSGLDQGLPTSAAVGTLVRTTIQAPKDAAPAVGGGANTNLYLKSGAPSPWNLMERRTVWNGVENGSKAAETQFVYDSHGNVQQENALDQRGTGGEVYRSTNYGRDARGRVTSVTDADGVGTSYTYGNCPNASDEKFALSAVTKTGIGSTAYEFNCGTLPLMTKRTNPNGRVDLFAYDTLGRLTQVELGVLKRTRYVYDDQAMWVMTREDRNAFRDEQGTVVEYGDQLGRTRKTRTLESLPSSDTDAANESGAAIVVETTYETNTTRNAVMVSNPYKTGTPTEARGWTVTLQDRMGRTCAVEHYAGAAAPTAAGTCANAGTGHGGRMSLAHGASADGAEVIETIEGTPSQVRVKATDGLGRLWKVTENGTDATTYVFDAADRLTGVNQGARTRTFTYSTAGWLLTADNPESGLTTYDYTVGGRLLTKKDARNVTACMGTWNGTACAGSFDGAGRPLQKSYSDGVTSTVNFSYEFDRLKQAANVSATVSYDSFDLLDRPLSRTQTMAGGSSYTATATYRPSGVATETYPGGRAITYSVDTVGRVTGVSAVKNSVTTNYLTAASYAAHGAAASLSFGDGLTESWAWNHRLQPVSIGRGTGFSLSYAYCPSGQPSCTTNNGNVVSVGIQPLNATQTFTFDALNRVKTFVDSGGVSQTYVYDRYGNRALLSGTLNGNYIPAAPPAPQVSVNSATEVEAIFPNNRWTNATADLAGNLTQPATGAYPQLTYDGEGLVASAVTGSTASEAYSYDGEGRRVKKVAGTVVTHYVYGTQADLVAEYSTVGSSEIGTKYLTADHLGSTRLVTGPDGVVEKRYDYLPFGQELVAGVAGRTAALKYQDGLATDKMRVRFTGKERDEETGLDYFGARYFSGAQGRFTSPDPKMFPSAVYDPQSWNKYGYTRNNPLRYVDPDGEDWEDALKGAINAFTSNNALGLGRIDSGNSDFRAGQAIGDAVSAIQGAAEILGGTGGEAGGLALDATGVGAIAGVPLNVASASVIAHGAAVGGLGLGNLTGALFRNVTNPDGSKGKPDHQAKVDELTTKAKGEAGTGEQVVRERKVQGQDSNRRPDVQIVDKNGRTRKVFEAERRPNSTRNRKREEEYDRLRIERETHRVP